MSRSIAYDCAAQVPERRAISGVQPFALAQHPFGMLSIARTGSVFHELSDDESEHLFGRPHVTERTINRMQRGVMALIGNACICVGNHDDAIA